MYLLDYSLNNNKSIKYRGEIMIKFTRLLQLATSFLLLLELYVPDIWIDFHLIAAIISVVIVLNSRRCYCIIVKYNYALIGLYLLKYVLFQATFFLGLIWCLYFVASVYLALVIFFISFKIVW